ncbi:MAG TPA: SpoIIE family protein phosphatase [Bryobacteraceae bacterium]|nr:SpoIIE family protein phosphatase [Bryobacteraceae bacterium]
MDAIPREVVNSALRLNLPYFGLASIIAVAGACSLFLARLRSRDRLLLWTGLFSILYAVRLFAENELVRDAFNAPATEYRPFVLCITYVINIPFALFALELFGHGWQKTIAGWTWVCIVFAMVAVPGALLFPGRHWLDVLNNVLVICGTLLIVLHVLIGRRARNPLVTPLLWPMLVFGFFVLLENEGFRIAGQSVEPIGFLILLAGLASIAVRRALARERKLVNVEQELSTARRIQFSILPQSAPNFEGVQLAVRYQPMTSVAGDFYDFLVPSENFLTILVADVSGHGVPAALVSCMLKVCFAAQKGNSMSPAAILSGLGLMLRDSLGGQYVTAACATIDRRSRRILYAGAGHPPSLLARGAEGDSLLLDENGLFMGPFPHATYTEISVPFRSGDRLLLYTDGITEALDVTGEEFGRERLRQFLVNSNGTPPASTLDQLFQQITARSPQDDLTAVLVHFE